MPIAIHAIQSVAPSNLNRDDTGAPKDAVFGGVRRARISSQSLKRAARVWWREQYHDGDLATRTRRLGSLVARELEERHGLPAEEGAALGDAATAALGLKGNERRSGETAVLVFVAPGEVRRLADVVAANGDLVREGGEQAAALLRDAFGDSSAIDLALFGRMLAEVSGTNVDAACSVAHAISTHEARLEEDYFTAVDDLKPADEDLGAGMIGEVLFQSAVFYRYSSIDCAQLAENLGGNHDLARRAVSSYVQAVARSLPSGHQTTFAAHNPPSALMVTLEPDAVSLANAFLDPVRPRPGKRLDALSADRLIAEWKAASTLLGGERSAAICMLDALGAEDVELPDDVERLASIDEVADAAGAFYSRAHGLPVG